MGINWVKMPRIPRSLKKAASTTGKAGSKSKAENKGKKSKLSIGVVVVLTAAGLGSYAVSSGVAPHDPASAAVTTPALDEASLPNLYLGACAADPNIAIFGADTYQASTAKAEQDCSTLPTLDIPQVSTPAVTAPVVVAPTVPKVAAPEQVVVHHVTDPATTPVVAPADPTTVTIIPACPKGQLPLEIPTTAKWQCVPDPTIVPVVVPVVPVTPVVVPQPTNPVVTPVVVDPAPVPVDPEMDPFVFNLKTQASYFSWVADPALLLNYGVALCHTTTPLTVPVPDNQNPLHPLTSADVSLALTTAATVCPGAWVMPTPDQITATPPVLAPVVPVVAPVQPVNVVPPVVPPVTSNDVILTH